MVTTARDAISNLLKKETTPGIFLILAAALALTIGTLAFDDPEHAKAVRIGVLSASTLSAIAGYLVLRYVTGIRIANAGESHAAA
ncbi:MAG: Na+/H+ antiporter NhaA [Proteobacteria bacterium]|nr:Na+/H+ antiporter NhaA [Pseudomonadota bacterium]